MARMMTKSRPVVEGNTGMKFSEIIVIILAIAGIVMGVRWYMNYRNSATFALSEFMADIKAGNVENQYALLDETDKKNFFPTRKAYENNVTLAHGYTERVENVALSPEEPDAKDADKVTIPMSVVVRDSVVGKEIYNNGTTKSYSDKIVMRKNSDGKWRVLLSASIDKSTRQLNMQKATPSPNSQF